MLVLTRRPNEEIVITTPDGEEIVINVIDVRGDKARLGVTAEKSVTIHRREVHEKLASLTQESEEATPEPARSFRPVRPVMPERR